MSPYTIHAKFITIKPNIKLKNKLNLILFISFFLAASLTIWVYYQTTNRTGKIEFNKDIDDPEFVVCDEDRILQYYSVKTSYPGGKREIKKQFSKLISNLTFKDSGLITFRFVVNCNGDVGRFRVKMVNFQLKKNHFEDQKIKQIQKEIQKLKKWNPGKWRSESFDSYYVLNFKIENSKITDIF